MAASRIYTRHEIHNLIAAGQTIIIYHNDVLRLSNAWKERHPGGKLVLDHMVGREASAEIDAWVYTNSFKACSADTRSTSLTNLLR